MNNNRLWLLLITLIAIGAIGLYAVPSDATHPTPIALKTYSGGAAGGAVPYSPKKSCGGCHIYNCVTPTPDNLRGFCTTQGVDFSDYESTFETVTKTFYKSKANGALDASTVTETNQAPKHGVSAGFHFQQGRNINWNTGAQDFYGLPKFTSAPGMYGKF